MISAKMSVLLATCHGRDYLAVVPQEIHDDLLNNFDETSLDEISTVKVEWEQKEKLYGNTKAAAASEPSIFLCDFHSELHLNLIASRLCQKEIGFVLFLFQFCTKSEDCENI